MVKFPPLMTAPASKPAKLADDALLRYWLDKVLTLPGFRHLAGEPTLPVLDSDLLLLFDSFPVFIGTFSMSLSEGDVTVETGTIALDGTRCKICDMCLC